MLQTGFAFVSGAFAGGYALRFCDAPSCQAQLGGFGKSRTFKLSIVVHSATLSEVEGGGVIENQRPLIGISVGDRSPKETELGDWSKVKGQWRFSKEAITVSVNADDEIDVYVSSATSYNLLVAAVSLTVRRVGELKVGVSEILSHLRMEILRERVLHNDPDMVSVEDRDSDSALYTTPVLPYNVTSRGKHVGCLHLSFETQNAPPSLDVGCWPQACAMEEQMHRKDGHGSGSSLGLVKALPALPSNARGGHVDFRGSAPLPQNQECQLPEQDALRYATSATTTTTTMTTTHTAITTSAFPPAHSDNFERAPLATRYPTLAAEPIGGLLLNVDEGRAAIRDVA